MVYIGSLDFVREITPHTFGARVRALRKAAKLSQPELAKLVGIKQSSLSDIETGETSVKNVKAPTMAGLVEKLKTSEQYLKTGTHPPTPKGSHSPAEAELLAIYRSLPKNKRVLLLERARGMQDARIPEEAEPA